MFNLRTTDAFARWFASLQNGPAEDVAAALEVIVQVGTVAEAPGSSDSLLWYEHPSLTLQRVDEFQRRFSPDFVKATEEWGRFHGYVSRIVKHLQNATFRARLERLAPENAAAVADAVQTIRKMTTRRTLAFSELVAKRKLSPLVAPTPSALATASRLANVDEIREVYFAALAAAGFAVADVDPPVGVLREISLRSTVPGIRILYGIDQARDRGLVVLAEWLDRSFYGDSVRQAEAVWKLFLQENVVTNPSSAVP